MTPDDVDLVRLPVCRWPGCVDPGNRPWPKPAVLVTPSGLPLCVEHYENDRELTA